MWPTEKMHRISILGLCIVGIVLILVLRLAWMQLIQGPQYKRVADENRTRRITAQAPRGTIYDRSGRILADNRPSFAVSIIPGEFTNTPESITLLAGIAGISGQEVQLMLQKADETPYTPVRLKRDIDQTLIAKIRERRLALPGVFIEALPIRYYPQKAAAAHLLGYVGRISEEEYEAKKEAGYNPNEFVGKDGLEQQWEGWLRGRDGGRQVEVDAAGDEVKSIGMTEAIPGKSLGLTLDLTLQQAAEAALAEQVETSKNAGQPAKGGAVVVLSVQDGGVRVMASAPAFDPNLFAGGISTKDWGAILNNPNHPLNNRAIQNAYPPGSVFKIVTAAAVLDSGLTTPEEVIEDKGFYIVNGWTFYGWETKGLGRLTLAGALAWSSDPYFYEMGRRLGPDRLASYAKTFGFGEKSGIELAGEVGGMVPTEGWKQETYGEEWYPGETLIAAIGQGYYLATPMQQALLLMAVANGGIVYKPRLVEKIYNPAGYVTDTIKPEVLRTIYLRPEHWGALRQGLEAVVSSGTGAGAFRGLGQRVAGKSGSAETGNGTTHSWFACYAPADKPEIVVAALVEEGGEGSSAAAPVVRKVLEAYFGSSAQVPLNEKKN